MHRSQDRRTRIIFWVISVMVVLSMGLSLAGTLVTPRQPTPTPVMPTLTPYPTRTPTPLPPSG